MDDNGGIASWKYIYGNIENYYPNIKAPRDWQVALRGILYRELRLGQHFKRIGLGVFALLNYQEKEVINENEPIKSDFRIPFKKAQVFSRLSGDYAARCANYW